MTDNTCDHCLINPATNVIVVDRDDDNYAERQVRLCDECYEEIKEEYEQ
jgi:hypothetical protein